MYSGICLWAESDAADSGMSIFLHQYSEVGSGFLRGRIAFLMFRNEPAENATLVCKNPENSAEKPPSGTALWSHVCVVIVGIRYGSITEECLLDQKQWGISEFNVPVFCQLGMDRIDVF